jgi:hypothetical protein
LKCPPLPPILVTLWTLLLDHGVKKEKDIIRESVGKFIRELAEEQRMTDITIENRRQVRVGKIFCQIYTLRIV